MVKFFLNDTLLADQPEGWQDFELNVQRDYARRMVLNSYPISLAFWGDGHDIIKADFDDNGYTSEISFRAEFGALIVKGILFQKDVQRNLNKCLASVEITDDGVGARILNNLTIKANPLIGKSKNDTIISPASAFGLDIFDVNGVRGSDITNTLAHNGLRRAFDIKDVLDFLVRFMSDGLISGVKSDYLDNLIDQRSIAVVQGSELRLGAAAAGDATPMDISFEQAFETVSKIHNLWLGTERLGDDIFVRIENEDFFTNAAIGITLLAVDDLIQEVARMRMYSRIRLGSPDAVEGGDLDGPASTGTLLYVRFLAFKEEEYHIETKSNNNQDLDLTIDKAQIDNNVIEDAIMNDNDEYDDDVFFIQYVKSTELAYSRNPFAIVGLGSHIYNRDFFNDRVAGRYNLQGNIAKFLGDGDDEFESKNSATDFVEILINPSGTATALFTDPFQFDNEISDPNGNYNNSTFRYTSPQSGIYNFKINIDWKTEFMVPSAYWQLDIKLRKFDSGNVFISEQSFTSPKFYDNNANLSTLAVFQAAVNGGEYVEVQISGTSNIIVLSTPTNPPKATIKIGSVFECIETTNGGGVFETKDSDSFKVSVLTFDKYFAKDQMIVLNDSPFTKIKLDNGKEDFTGWADNINIKLNTGEAQVELINDFK